MSSSTNIIDNDISSQLAEDVKTAILTKSPIAIQGGNSKSFLGNTTEGSALNISPHTGVIDYDPTELCITVRAGTKLSEIESLLDVKNQMLPFEPPQYSSESTIGGSIATGLAGPRRAYTSSVRDAILGVKMINGHGDIVSFGGQVMKNVAGYDLSRMMVRSFGTLGLILEVSIRLLPKQQQDITIQFEASQEEALSSFQSPFIKQLPITASAWFDKKAYIRLSGSEKVLDNKINELSNKINIDIFNDMLFWQDVRDHKHHFFERADKPLWRLSLPPTSEQIAQIGDSQFIEWGGAQRWVSTNTPANIIHNTAKSRNGFATLFKGDLPEAARFSKLDDQLMKLHRQLKRNMDPHNIFNPNKMYLGL